MSEVFDNTTFSVAQSTIGATLLGSFTGTSAVSGFAGATVNGTIDRPGSAVGLDLNIGGIVQAGLPGTYTGFSTPLGGGEPVYYFDVTPAGLQAPVTLAVTAGALPALNVLTPINTTNVTAPDSAIICFAEGTLIRTARGDVAVEHLSVGDLALTTSGEHRPIRWLGHRSIACRNHPNSDGVLPVRILAGALAEGLPARDLVVSPGHAICFDILGEKFVPASVLVNGATIVRDAVETVTYWHVELDSHDVILAEGQPAESYLDMRNRSFFTESGVVGLTAVPDAPILTHADFCRPYYADGVVVETVRTLLRARALELGWELDGAPLAGLHLEVDGRTIEPETDGLLARFVLPASAQDVWLVSQTSVPHHVASYADARTLGVCIEGLTMEDGLGDLRRVALDDGLLCLGFHAVEGGRQRWTAGRARLPAELFAGCRGTLSLTVALAGPALPRWVAPAVAAHDATATPARLPRLAIAA